MALIKSIPISKSGLPEGGTLKYIAPEYLNDPLKKKSEPFDVYGFAISAWEIFSEKHPYYGYDARLLKIFVGEQGIRPEISDMGDAIPQVVVKLIQECWGQEETSRPAFHDVIGIISDQLCLADDDLRRSMDEESNISTEQIATPAEQSSIVSNPTPVSGITESSFTTSEIQACTKGFRKVLTSLSLYSDPEYGLLPCLQFKGIITNAECSLLEDLKSDTTKTYIELNEELLRKYINPKFES